MKKLHKLAHVVYECKYHFVWCPKYKFRVLTGKVGRSVRDIIKQLCKWKKLEILDGNVQKDHIHLVLSIPPKYSVSEMAGFLKGKCVIKMFNMYLYMNKRYRGKHSILRKYNRP